MTPHEFRRLLDRYQHGACTPAERERLEQWLKTLDARSERFEEWDPVARQRVGERMRAALEGKLETSRERSVRRLLPAPYVRLAAALVLLLGGVYGVSVFFFGSQTDTPVAYQTRTSTGGVTKTILADGTLVWLKGASTVSFPATYGGRQREVWLEGEAFFEVAKDSLHPFLIHCGPLLTRVLGTSFNLKRSADDRQIEVAVFTGKVGLTHSGNPEELLLLPEQGATYRTQDQSLRRTPIGNRQSYLRGTEYDMRLEEVPLREVVARIERKFGVSIAVETPQIENCVITADMTDQSLVTSLALITQALGGEYRRSDNGFRLRLPGCP